MTCISVRHLIKNNDGAGVLISVTLLRRGTLAFLTAMLAMTFFQWAITVFGQYALDTDRLSSYLNCLIIQGVQEEISPARGNFFCVFWHPSFNN